MIFEGDIESKKQVFFYIFFLCLETGPPKTGENLSFLKMSPLGQEWMDPTQNKKGGPMNVKVPEIEKLLERDPYLKPHERELRRR